MKNKNIFVTITLVLVCFSSVSYAMSSVQKNLWKIAESGATYPIGYFKDVDANIKNEGGQTPLMIATKNGYSDVIRSLSDADVNVWERDNEGKTAFDYIKNSTTQREAMSSKRVYGALRVLEVEQLLKGYAKIVSYSYENDIDFLSILISGETCYRFKFPKNTKCKTVPKKKKSSHNIFHAIKSKDNKMFDILLKEVDLNITNRHDYSLLWAGIHYKNLYVVDQVLKKGADMDKLDSNQLHKPISWAIIHNEVGLLQVLLDNGVDVNAKGKFGKPILFKAMYKCQSFETIALLLDNGANPYLKDARGQTVFDVKPVFCKDKLQIAKMKQLLRDKAKSNTKEKATGQNKKRMLAYKQKRELETKAIAHSKLDRYISTLNSVDDTDEQGYTALHKAVAIKHYKAIKKLLKQGANMYALEKQFSVWTPFNYTLAIDDKKALKIFLDNGVDVNFHHKNGSTILNDASRRCNSEMVEFLLDNGADPRFKDGYGANTITAAKKCNKKEKKEIELLVKKVMIDGKNRTLLKAKKITFEIEKKREILKKKQAINDTYKKEIKDTKNPIFAAIEYKKNRDFDSYINSIDNMELKDNEEKTLLYVAVEKRNHYAIGKLLQKGANMNAMEAYRTYTPFTYAAALNELKIVEMFLDNGADVNYQYKKSLPLLALAVKQCNIKLIKLLLDNGAETTLEDKRGDNAIASLGHCNKRDNARIEKLIKK